MLWQVLEAEYSVPGNLETTQNALLAWRWSLRHWYVSAATRPWCHCHLWPISHPRSLSIIGSNVFHIIDGFHDAFYHGNWRHYITMLPGDWSISTSRPFCPPVSMAKNAMESMYSYFVQCMSGSKGFDMQKEWRYQITYHMYLASGGQLSYAPNS